eukprot:jgi/Phyca11/131976/e_gw1.125.17.1
MDVRYESVAHYFKPINGTRVLKSIENCGEDFEPDEGRVHVLVVAPVTVLMLQDPPYCHFVVDGVNIPITDNMAFNLPGLTGFWKAFQEVDTEIEANTAIKLPEGTFLLGDSNRGSCIYIRSCYLQLWEITQKVVQDEVKKATNLVIDGNSGIGKTYFGYVMLLYLARLGETVVYESYGTKKRVLLSHNVVVEGSQQDFSDILNLPTTFYIVDGVEPMHYQAKTIFLASLDHTLWYTFNEKRDQIRYIPVWSWDELSTCREVLYSDVPESVVEGCFHRWGGIPRYVLQYAQSEEKQILLEKTMEIADFFWLLNGYEKLKANNPEAHRLLHYRVNDHFAKEYFDFASPYVQQEVYDRAYKKDKRVLLGFIGGGDGWKW